MSNNEVRTLEERIAKIEENLGIDGVKTLKEAAEEEAERAKQASAIAFRTRYARREIGSKAQLEKLLRTTVVIFCDSFDDTETRKGIEAMARLFQGDHPGSIAGYIGLINFSWGYWERSSPMFELSNDELEKYTEGNELPCARFPDQDPNSSETTLVVMKDGGMQDGLNTWLMELFRNMGD